MTVRADAGFFSHDMIAALGAREAAARRAPHPPARRQRELWPNWRHHSFVTDRHDLDTCAADAYHRAHATVELAIRDLKESAGLSRCPSGRFFANGAWLACCVLAHNLARWTARLGRAHPTRQLTVAATIRNRLLTVPGRLVNHSGRHRLRLPLNWPVMVLGSCPVSGG